MTGRKPCIDLIGPARCTGCFGCQSACAQDAVRLALDSHGFYKPEIDRQACNGCGICQERCPVLAASRLVSENGAEPVAFAAWTRDESIRLGSSSGGMFSELAKPVIEAGGMVVGCIWDGCWTPRHVAARTWAEVQPMRGSKYVPSHLGGIYQEIVGALRDGERAILFCGTPCQVVALAAALTPEQRKRTLLVDFICHGVPSLLVFHRYVEELFEGEPVSAFTFRDKALGWLTIRAASADGRIHHVSAADDAFYQGFAGHHLYVMESCHQCEFARLPRVGDLTLGDFWGCPEEWSDRRGVSVVLVNTPAGRAALEGLEARGSAEVRRTDLATAIGCNPRATSAGRYSIPRCRRAFLDAMVGGESFARLKDKYFPTPWQQWLARFWESRSKSRFLAAHVYHRFRRILGTR